MTLDRAELAYEAWPEAFERRERRRRDHVEPVAFEWEGRQVEAELRNSSHRGVFVVSEAELRPGQHVVLVHRGNRWKVEVIHHRPVARSLVGLGRAGAGLRLL